MVFLEAFDVSTTYIVHIVLYLTQWNKHYLLIYKETSRRKRKMPRPTTTFENDKMVVAFGSVFGI